MHAFCRAAFLSLIFAGATAPGVARLGETEKEMVERYGKVIMRAPESVIEQGRIHALADNLHFRLEGWNITARILNGRCESITYSKPGDWTEEQFRHVLESNGGRGQWEERKTATPKTHREWLRRDGKTAVWRMLQSMTLSTRAFEQAREALKAKAKEDASRLPKI